MIGEGYKLTDQNMRTRGNCQWILGEWKRATGAGTKLCTNGYLHYYTNPLLAVFMNPIYGNIENPRFFRAEIQGKTLDDHGLKCGAKRMRIVEELPVPELTITQRTEIAIRIAKCVCKDPRWNAWADSWLTGSHRTARAAWAAAEAARAAWAARVAARAAAEHIDIVAIIHSVVSKKTEDV